MIISFWGGVDSAVCSVAACKTDDSNKWESMYICEFHVYILLYERPAQLKCYGSLYWPSLELRSRLTACGVYGSLNLNPDEYHPWLHIRSDTGLTPACTATMSTSASARWWTPARCCRSVMPAWSACWRGWPTCASFPSTSWTPSSTRTVSSPAPMSCLTSLSPSTKSPSVPYLHGEGSSVMLPRDLW